MTIPFVYPILDHEKFQKLPLGKQQALEIYIDKLPIKPIFLLLFGSTANKTFTTESDIDLVIISDTIMDDELAKKAVSTHTNEKIQSFHVTFSDFLQNIRTLEDKVLISAMNTGYPVFNERYYYEVLDAQKRR
jgi:hypothetical protein